MPPTARPTAANADLGNTNKSIREELAEFLADPKRGIKYDSLWRGEGIITGSESRAIEIRIDGPWAEGGEGGEIIRAVHSTKNGRSRIAAVRLSGKLRGIKAAGVQAQVVQAVEAALNGSAQTGNWCEVHP